MNSLVLLAPLPLRMTSGALTLIIYLLVKRIKGWGLKIAQWCNQYTPRGGMYLLVNQDNLRAQQFYLKCGARNIMTGVWNAPDGNVVLAYIFAWESIEALLENG